jgi:uroporphyrinogen-III decarboxylase
MDTETDARAARALLDSCCAERRGKGEGRNSGDDAGSKLAATLQGNLNPAVLRRSDGGSEAAVKEAVAQLLKQAGTQSLIANLGEGS